MNTECRLLSFGTSLLSGLVWAYVFIKTDFGMCSVSSYYLCSLMPSVSMVAFFASVAVLVLSVVSLFLSSRVLTYIVGAYVLIMIGLAVALPSASFYLADTMLDCTLSGQSVDDACFLRAATKQADVVLCEQMRSTDARSSCIAQVTWNARVSD